MTNSKSVKARNIQRLLNSVTNAECWHVTVGGSTLPQFTLALGEKIRRENPLKNRSLPAEFRNFEGNVSFFIRCWWRLENGDSILVSSIGSERKIVRELNRLVGRRLLQVSVVEPAWDLLLEFSSKYRLRILCNQADKALKHLKNWHARIGSHAIYAGPGANVEFAERRGLGR